MTSQLSIRDKSDKMYLRRLCHAGLLQVCRSTLQHIIAILFFCIYFFGRPLRTENTVFHSTTGVTLHFLSFIYHFHIDHSAPCFSLGRGRSGYETSLLYSPQHFTYPLFPISTGYYIRPKKNRRQWFCKCYFFLLGVGGEGGGVNKVYYGLCENGEFSIFFSPRISHLDPPLGHGGLIFFFLFSNTNYFKTMPKESS